MHDPWKPSTTVAAVIERGGKFLLVEEHTLEGLRLNNPAGHLEEGESLLQACVRETLEETGYDFEPQGLLGIYMSRFARPVQAGQPAQDVTYLRFAFVGLLGAHHAERALDTGIERTLWMPAQEIEASANRHRSPLLLRCMHDYLNGQRLPLSAIYTDASVQTVGMQP